ncbi:hypothetical protein HYV30_00580 [Candidatus Kaiserbacteria bacterium]|nr:hypothetical protein [Candidatus Kaiserbacteria bacterium]
MAKEQENDIDSLARMVADGFSAMNERFDEVDKRFDRLEGRMDKLETAVHEVHQRIDQVVRPELDDQARHIKDLEIRVA